MVNGGSNITLRDMIIRGAHPSGGTSPSAYVPKLEGQHGVGLGSVQGALVEDVQIYDVYGDFIAVQWDWRLSDNVLAAAPARDITIRRVRAERNGRQSLFIGHAERVRMEHSYLGDTNQNHIDLEPDVVEHMARNITLVDNEFGPVRFTTLGNETGVAPLVGNVTFSRNVVKSPAGTCYPPVWVVAQAGALKSGWTIENNTITQANPAYWSGAFNLNYARNVVIRGNIVNNLSTAGGCGSAVYGARLSNVDTATVTGNSFHGAQVAVVQINSSGVTASNNIP